MTLSRRLSPRPWEPAYGLLARMAVLHGFSDVGAFAATAVGDAGLPLRARQGASIGAVAELAGCHADILRRTSLTPNDRGSWTLAGQLVDLRRNRAFGVQFGGVCPACLAGDAARRGGPPGSGPHRRAFWDLAAISCCHDHKLRLLRSCPDCAAELRADAIRPDLCPCGMDLKVARRDVVSAADLPGEAYLLGRLGVIHSRPHKMLDGLDFGLAVEAMRVMGSASAGVDPRVEFVGMGSDRLPKALTAGMRVLGGGDEAFVALLDRMAEAVPLVERSPQRVYGVLQHWLEAAGDAFAPHRALFLAHAEANTLTRKGTRVLGAAPRSAGAWTTLGQVARRRSVSVERLGTIAKLSGWMDAGVDVSRSLPVTNEVAERLEAFLTSTIDRPEVRRRLCVSNGVIDDLLRHGGLRLALPTGKTSIPSSFRTDEVDRLVERLRGPLARAVDERGVGTIAEAVRIAFRTTGEIATAVADGRLVSHGGFDEGGLLHVLVRFDDVPRALPRRTDPNLISVPDAARRLGVSHPTIAFLKERGLLRAYAGRTELRAAPGLDVRQVEAILRSHATTSEMRGWVEPATSASKIHRVLSAAGLRPSIEAPQPLFDRGDAHRIIDAWSQARLTEATSSGAVCWPFAPIEHDASNAHEDVSDAEWSVIEPLLPACATELRDTLRPALNGVLWRFRTDAPWSAVPARYGSHMRCVNRWRQWWDDGTWSRILDAMAILHGGIDPVGSDLARTRGDRKLGPVVAWKPNRRPTSPWVEGR